MAINISHGIYGTHDVMVDSQALGPEWRGAVHAISVYSVQAAYMDNLAPRL